MTSPHFRYIVLQNGIGAGIFNLLLNGGIAWVLLQGRPTFPVWGAESVIGDTLLTAFLLAFVTHMIVSRQARREVSRGKVQPLRRDLDGWWSALLSWLLGRLPAGDLGRAGLLGVSSLLCFGIPSVVALEVSGVAKLTAEQFVVFKACFAGFAALLVTPLTVMLTLGEKASALAARAVAKSSTGSP